MVKLHHLQLRVCYPLFYNFHQFQVEAAWGHHPVIQKEVQQLVAKGSIEPSTVVLVSIPVCVIPKHLGGLHPILSVKWFNCYMHITSFRMPTIKQVQQLIQQGDYASSIGLKDAYLFLLSSIIVIFCDLFGKINLISGTFCHLGLL